MIGRAFAWVRANWYTEVLPLVGVGVGLHGLMNGDAYDLALGAMIVAWSGWLRERDDGR